MAALSKFLPNPRAVGAGVALFAGLLLYFSRRHGRKVKVSATKGEANSKKGKAAVDLRFFKQLFQLLRIVIPSVFSPEVGYLLLVAVMLVLRTYADIWTIQNATNIEGAIISMDNARFMANLLKFVYAMPVIAIINNLLKYGLNELKLRFRTRLSTHLYDEYMRGFTYYKMTNLDKRIRNPDQLLTQDVERFCDTLAELYSNISKPILDICLYVYRLIGSIGAQGPLTMLTYLAVSGLILTILRAPVGSMTVREQHLEGQLRSDTKRVITNSEEISFYQGSTRERLTIKSTLDQLVDHLRGLIQFQFSMGFLDTLIAKYIGTVVGYFTVSQPFLRSNKYVNTPHRERVQEYYRSGRMLVRMSQAIGMLVLSGREMTRLAGFTDRMSELIAVLRDLNQGGYVPHPGDEPRVPDFGEIVEEDRIIRFEHVPLVTPNGDMLVKDMNFEVRSGRNVLVCGPNGCGKSSLFRILGELWPLFGGKVVKPHRSKLFYVPQRPYMTLSTLRDQVIYPNTHEDQQRRDISDQKLEEFLNEVQLSYLLEREGGWETVKDWMDVLSGGEKQRMAMARLFYHKPQFAILDECTSAVSVDVEGVLYSHCRKKDITLFTVAHKQSLRKYHEYVLEFDGRGSYEFKSIVPNMEEFGS